MECPICSLDNSARVKTKAFLCKATIKMSMPWLTNWERKRLECGCKKTIPMLSDSLLEESKWIPLFYYFRIFNLIHYFISYYDSFRGSIFYILLISEKFWNILYTSLVNSDRIISLAKLGFVWRNLSPRRGPGGSLGNK